MQSWDPGALGCAVLLTWNPQLPGLSPVPTLWACLILRDELEDLLLHNLVLASPAGHPQQGPRAAPLTAQGLIS